MQLQGKTALITGSCGDGIGRSTALRLAREGANIVLNYGTHRRGPEMQARAKQIAAAIAELGGRALIHEADSTDEAQVVAMVAAAQRAFGGVDILVNNAGGDWHIRDYTEIPFADWQAVLAAEVNGPFLLLKHTVPGMRAKGWGRVVHISMEGALRMAGMRGLAPDYCLGKAARAWMTQAFGPGELARGITVNAVEPGIIDHLSWEDALAAARGPLPVSRTQATPADIAEVIAFLCSEAGRFVTTSAVCVTQP